MSDNDASPVLKVPSREIPVPSSVSIEAQQVLALGAMFELPEYPPLDDPESWRKLNEASNEFMLSQLDGSSQGFEITDANVEGVDVFVLTPPGTVTDGRVYLEIHGGGLINGGGACCRAMAIYTAAQVGLPMWAVDYRMPPDHPYPASLDDCVTVYRALLKVRRPEEIVVGGASAGGNLAAALILRARDEGLPLPAVAVLLTPELDLTESGDTFQTNFGVDTVLTRSLMPANLLYAGGHDLGDPYLSPLFGDFTKGFPPTILSAGTRDVFLSNAVRMHRALREAGVPADLHVLEAAPHGGFMVDTPEGRYLEQQVRQFIDTHCSTGQV